MDMANGIQVNLEDPQQIVRVTENGSQLYQNNAGGLRRLTLDSRTLEYPLTWRVALTVLTAPLWHIWLWWRVNRPASARRRTGFLVMAGIYTRAASGTPTVVVSRCHTN